MCEYYSLYASPIGELTLTASARALTAVFFPTQKDGSPKARRFAACRDSLEPAPAQNAPLCAARRWLDAYFAHQPLPPLPPLWPLAVPLIPAAEPPTTPPSPASRNPDSPSAFQLKVWQLLAAVPYGALTSYGELAAQLVTQAAQNTSQGGSGRMSAQAVGGAVGRNPLAIVLPCHRVVGAGGALTGFGGGLEVKRWLLRHEGHHVDAVRVW